MDIPDAHIYFFTPSIMDRYFREIGFSNKVDVYNFYNKSNMDYKLMKKMGIKPSKGYPRTSIERLFYSYLFKASEVAFSRRRFDWVVK